MPVPGDLPVFVRLATAVLAAQDPAGRVETLVIPDRVTPGFMDAFERARADLGGEPVRLIPMSRRSRVFQGAGANPGANHFLQVFEGVSHAAASHVLLHDADLFIDDPTFLARHFRACRDRGLACLGVSPPWDGWIPEHGGAHVVATWELMADVGWLRARAPWEHRPQIRSWAGERHLFDLTLFSQLRSSPHSCALNPDSSGLLHFNYVISTYRRFQRSERLEDGRFLLLLIRLLTDAFADGDDAASDLPGLDELAAGLGDGRRVTYRSPETAASYAPFRAQLQRLLRAPFVGAERARVIEDGLAPFDAAFGPLSPGSAAA
jgi:hypothetical protein